MTIESLAQRIERAADPDRFCTAVAACLERNGGDLEGALELADTILMPQFDDEFERFHPRGDGGRFVEKSKHAKTRHANERARRHAERKPRDAGPKSGNRQAVEQHMHDPELRQQLVGIASKIGTDLRSQIDPDDIVQDAMVRALKEADGLELTDVPGWLRKKTEESLRDATKGARAFKRGRGHKLMSLDEELDYAAEIGQQNDIDPIMVIGQALSKLAESDPEGAKLLSSYHAQKRGSKRKYPPAQRKRAERARAKLRPILDEIKRKLANVDRAPDFTPEDVPGRPSSEHAMAPGPKGKPPEQRLPEDLQWRKAGVTAAAHEGKVWHRKSPERIAVKKLAKHLNLSPEQTAAIHNIVRKKDYLAGGKGPAQFDYNPEAVRQAMGQVQGRRHASSLRSLRPIDVSRLPRKKRREVEHWLHNPAWANPETIQEMIDSAPEFLPKLLYRGTNTSSEPFEHFASAHASGEPVVLKRHRSFSGKPEVADAFFSPSYGGAMVHVIGTGGLYLGDQPGLDQDEMVLPEGTKLHVLHVDPKTKHVVAVAQHPEDEGEPPVFRSYRRKVPQPKEVAKPAAVFDEQPRVLIGGGRPSAADTARVMSNPRRGLLRRSKPVVVQSIGSVPPAAPDLASPHWEFRATDKAKGRRLGRRKLTDPLSTPRNWNTADGEIVPVDATTHWQAAQKAGEESPKQRGWIRTNAGSFEVDSLTPRAVAHILAVMRANPELWQGPGKVAVESKSHDNLFLGPEDLDSDPHALMPERRQPPSTYFDDTPPRGVAIGKTRSASTARVSDKPRQRMSPSWRTPSVAAYNQPPKISQQPGDQPLPGGSSGVSRVVIGKGANVAPLPHAARVAGEVARIRGAYRRLAKLPGVAFKVERQFPDRRGGEYRQGVFPWSGQIAGSVLRNQKGPPIPGTPERPLTSVRGRMQSNPESARALDRHEYGHHLWFKGLSKSEQDEWASLHGEHLPQITETTEYGARIPVESFAELFALYTHPEFGQAEHLPPLPPAIEAYFRRILGQES